MTKELTAVEAKVRFGAVLEAVERGEEIIVTRNGRRIARISPAEPDIAARRAAAEKLKDFGKGRRLDMDWRVLRDAGRK